MKKKTKKNEKRLATWQDRAEKGFKCMLEQIEILDKIRNLIVPSIERQYRFKVKLNDYWTNLYKN